MPPETIYPTPQMIDGLNAQAFDLRHQDTRHALEVCLRANELSLKIDYQRGYARSLYLIGLCRHILGMQEGVIETVQQALSLFESLGAESGQAEAYNLLGTIYKRRGDYPESIDLHQKSLAIRRRIGDKEGESGSLNNIGISLSEMAQFSNAFEYLYNSLNVAQSISSARNASYALFNIALIFIKIGDLEKALEYLQQSLELNHDTNDRALDSTILAELGRTHALLKNHEQAMTHLARSLELARQTGNSHDQGVALLNMGIAQQEHGRYNQAEESLHAALDIMKTTHARADEAGVLEALGRNYSLQGRYDEAIALLHASLQIAEQTHTNNRTWSAHNQLAEVFKAIGDFEQALNHHQIYHNLWKNYYSQDSESRIHAIIARSEVEKARRVAEEHRQRSDQLSQALTEAKRAEVEKTRMLTQLELQSKILEQLTREDGLTGLSNRRWLDIQLNQEFERARRFHHPFSIALLDVDNFKSVNDRFSHLVGDEVLRQAAGIFRNSCRMVDVIGRYGGEEFMIILVETTQKQALEVCHKILENFRNYPWRSVHPQLDTLTVSIGVSQNLQLTSPSEMIAAADVQLYRAKQQGKDRVCLPNA